MNMNFLKNKYVRFSFVSLIYILWVIWLRNYWFLLGIPIIFDMYVTKKVNWTFWKKREGKNSVIIEWLDALIFAVIAVTLINIFLFQNYKIPTGSMEKTLLIGDHLYVSKVAYGPKIPNTPLSFPFSQHTLPLTKQTKSYLEWIKLPYKRLKGFGSVKRKDVVVFNFPAGDTVVIQMQAQAYEQIVRGYADQLERSDQLGNRELKSPATYLQQARDYIWNNYDIVVRPVDKRDNYIKRCIGIPGDTVKIIDRQIFVNGEKQNYPNTLQFKYRITTDGTRINPKALERMDIYQDDVMTYSNTDYVIPLTSENVEKIRNFSNVIKVVPIEKQQGAYATYTFPHDPHYPWNEDNFGPLYIPKKGVKINLTLDNLPLYKRIINVYEKNDLQVRDSIIYINGEKATTYTFQMDYYFMMGDNRHDSADSRFWGFVPEDHIVGKPKFIWLSLAKDKKFLSRIRLKRMFMGV